MKMVQKIPKSMKFQLDHPSLFNFFDRILHNREISAYTDILTMVSPNEREFLFKLAKNTRNGAIVEIGCYAAGSTYFLAKGADISGVRVYSIDPFNTDLQRQHNEDDNSHYSAALDQKPSKREIEETIKRYSLDHIVTLIEGFSCEIALQWNDKISLLWIDGNHKEVREDFYAWKRYLTKDAVIAFHDTNYPQYGRFDVTDALDNIIHQEKAKKIGSVDSITAITLLQ